MLNNIPSVIERPLWHIWVFGRIYRPYATQIWGTMPLISMFMKNWRHMNTRVCFLLLLVCYLLLQARVRACMYTCNAHSSPRDPIWCLIHKSILFTHNSLLSLLLPLLYCSCFIWSSNIGKFNYMKGQTYTPSCMIYTCMIYTYDLYT